MDTTVEILVADVQRMLREAAVPADAGPMQAYMKSAMPFYGVKRPARRAIERHVKATFRPADRATWQAGVLALWRLPHREERYLALAVAAHHHRFLVVDTLPLLETMIREGAWWDLVDEITTRLVARVLEKDRPTTLSTFDRWITDDDVWVRRAAIIGQLKAKDRTDMERLAAYCTQCAADPSFWIRKAIGWALREHGKTDPAAVRAFVEAHHDALAPLSRREATRRLPEP